ncbi:MAG: protein kinase [Pseudomonadales bacterium]|nr:protein kinase [Pseudomonadales bacterium]
MSHPDTIGKYNIEGVLGKGAMGVVYKGFDPNIARPVAIKTIHKNLLDSEMGQEMLRRFQTEAQAVGKLTHANIVGIYEFDQYKGTPYFVMEFVEGKDLKTIVKEGQDIDLEEAIRIISSVLDGLAYVHEFGIVHRDIKPANIFITNKGVVKIADFGIARMDNSELTQVGSVLGTPSYMSPEQCIGAGVDARSDLFSTGVMLYELLTGRKPFRADQATAIINNVINLKPQNPTAINKALPSSCDQVIKKALAKNANQRYQTAKEFQEDLNKCSSGKHVYGPRAPWYIGGGVAAAAIVVVTGVGVALMSSDDTQDTAMDSASTSNAVNSTTAFETKPDIAVENSTNTVAVVQPPASNLTPKQQEKVDRLLDVARAHFLVGRLVAPQGSNALDAYRMVLDTDPVNQKALSGVEEVKERFFKRAKILWMQGEQEEAKQHLALAVQLFPNESEVTSLQQLMQP